MHCLTFELSGRRRQDARPGLVKMYRVPPARAWWPAGGAPRERGVRPHRALLDQLVFKSILLAFVGKAQVATGVLIEEPSGFRFIEQQFEH